LDPSSVDSRKRTGYLSWDDYFMCVARLSAMRSKDPSTQVGACIVNQEKRIVGVGYNGFPTGCSDDELPWGKEGPFLETKYPYVVHAEANAILNSIVTDLRGTSIYVALFPCNECAKLIIQAGIREVIYHSDKYADTDPVRASKLMFGQSGVRLRRYEPTRPTVSLELDRD
jgi:dCMP deaminase